MMVLDSDLKFVSGVNESPEEVEAGMQERWISGTSGRDRNNGGSYGIVSSEEEFRVILSVKLNTLICAEHP